MFQLIYIGKHNRCGLQFWCSDYRINSLEELKELNKEGIMPLDMYCNNCLEEFPPTHAEVIASEGLGVRDVLSESTLGEFFRRIPPWT